MAIQELTALVRPPDRPDEVGDLEKWASIEGELGFRLPRDYREFIFRYGSGVLCYHFRVFNVFSQNQNIGLPGIHRVCDNLRRFKKEEGDEYIPYSIFPERPGLLPWGNDYNGNEFYWLTEGKADDWSVVSSERGGPKWRKFDCTMTSFLGRALRKEIPGLWSGDFPAEHLIFQRLSDFDKKESLKQTSRENTTKKKSSKKRR